MIVLPPVIAVLWVVWTRLILEALVVHFKVEDNTRRTPLVDQTQPTSRGDRLSGKSLRVAE